MTPEEETGPSRGRLIAYGQIVIPLAVIGLPVAIYIPPFYSQTLGIDLAMVGFILMLARLSDVVTDPLIGRLSDRTRSRWGRRRPWILAGVPVMMVSAVMLFAPMGAVSSGYLLLWICAIYFGFTLITIPYGAWGAELATEYHARNRITGSREIFLLAGLLIAITLPIIGAFMAGEQDGAASKAAMAPLAWFTVLLLPVCTFVLFRFVPEPTPHEYKHVPFASGVRKALKNGPFRLILVTSSLGALAGSINAGVAILFYEHMAGIGKAGTILIFVLFAAGVAGSPFWVTLGGRIGKHMAIVVAGAISMAAFACVPVVIYWVKPQAPELVFWCLLGITLLQGITIGAAPIMGASIMADVVDLDTLRNGEQRTAFLFSFMSMVRKIFEAVGVGIALPVISWAGFNPQSDHNSSTALFALLAMYCLVPLVLWLASILVISRYPITRERQVRLRTALEKKLARQAAKG